MIEEISYLLSHDFLKMSLANAKEGVSKSFLATNIMNSHDSEAGFSRSAFNKGANKAIVYPNLENKSLRVIFRIVLVVGIVKIGLTL